MHFTEWLFWVSLTIFGTGLYFWIERKTWGGVVPTIVGSGGLLYTIRDKVQLGLGVALSQRRFWIGIGYILMVYVALYVGFYVRKLRSDLDTYVLPRLITAKQAATFRDFLSNHVAHSVAVKVTPGDQEALAYWGQICNAFRATQWTAEMRTDDTHPRPVNVGLCIHEHGSNAKPKPKTPKDDPAQLLQQAFQAAGIIVNGSGSVSAGEYKLYIMVGPRPMAIGVPSVKSRMVHWIISKLATIAR